MFLPDDDPRWDEHSGGSGHDGPAWTETDEGKALAYWDVLDGTARAILHYLFDRRGQQIHHSELVRELGLNPEGTKRSANVLAGSLYRAGDASAETDRRSPFRWWAGDDGAHYAVKDGTAAIFERALFAARAKREPGQVHAFRLSTDQVSPFIARLENTTDDADVRMVLGSACTTAVKAVQQFVAALQLPYKAAGGWQDFLDHLSARPASLRQCVVVTDACGLLKHEDDDMWRAAVAALHGGPYDLDGGWTTLVLVDDKSAWDEWVFRDITDVRLSH